MAFVSGYRILPKAFRKGYAVGSFNFSTIEIFNGITAGALAKRSPLILSTSENELKHFGMDNAAAAAQSFGSMHKIPVALNLDHGKTIFMVKKCVDAGYSCVHFDGSSLGRNKNVKLTKKTVSLAKRKGVWVEGELGIISGGSSVHTAKEKVNAEFFTDPQEAKEFVELTGVNALAVSIGNVHGLWKGSPKLDFKRLAEIKKKTRIPLVLHGGSGITPAQLKKAIPLGIAKVNVNTELRKAFSETLGKEISRKKGEVVPYHFLGKPREEVQKVVEKKILQFGSQKKA